MRREVERARSLDRVAGVRTLGQVLSRVKKRLRGGRTKDGNRFNNRVAVGIQERPLSNRVNGVNLQADQSVHLGGGHGTSECQQVRLAIVGKQTCQVGQRGVHRVRERREIRRGRERNAGELYRVQNVASDVQRRDIAAMKVLYVEAAVHHVAADVDLRVFREHQQQSPGRIIQRMGPDITRDIQLHRFGIVHVQRGRRVVSGPEIRVWVGGRPVLRRTAVRHDKAHQGAGLGSPQRATVSGRNVQLTHRRCEQNNVIGD